jgi:hypothetical protein
MRVQVTIKGISPLLMNRFTEQNEIALSSGTRPTFSTSGTRGTPREQAEPKVYKDDDGNLFVPGPNIFAALIAAGSFHKAGKSKITTMKTSLVPAAVMLEEIVCPLGTKDWEVDSRSVVIPSTGGRVMCHRPRIDDWKLTFTLEIDNTMFSMDLVRAIVDDAGKKCGLGDYRPSRKGPFGRFVVIEWLALETPVREAA